MWARVFKRHSSIYALSTHPGKAAIAVVRISGQESSTVYKALTARRSDPVPRQSSTAALYDSSGNVLDHGLTLFFKGPKSYTGEDLLELHLHGGQAVVRAVLDAVKHVKGLRYAESGEFTKRAFKNGRLDLTQIEGIRDVIEAETEVQRRAAITAAGGGAKQLYDGWRTEIVRNMGMLTALIDFSDDNADITGTLFADVKKDVGILLDEIKSHFNQAERSELVLSGVKLNMLGPPNAGKSSLLNAIVKREAAIVTDIPGTTRDVLEVGMDIQGYKVVLGDTAGLRSLESVRNAHDRIEQEGIKRAKERIRLGDVVLCVVPANETLGPDVLKEMSELREQKRMIVALNKCDIAQVDTKKFSEQIGIPVEDIVPVSCKTGESIPLLLDKIATICKELTMTLNGPPIGASQRIRDLLQHDVIAGLQSFLDCDDVVIATAELQFAIDGIGKITGSGVGVEEILGVVFSNFCIGK